VNEHCIDCTTAKKEMVAIAANVHTGKREDVTQERSEKVDVVGEVKLVSVEDIIAKPPQSRVPIPKEFEGLMRSVVPAPPGSAAQQIVGGEKKAVGGNRALPASRLIQAAEDTSPNAKLTPKAHLPIVKGEDRNAADAVQGEQGAMLALSASNLPKAHAKKVEEVLIARTEKAAQLPPTPSKPQPQSKAAKPDMKTIGQNDPIAEKVSEKLTTSSNVFSSKTAQSLSPISNTAPQTLRTKTAAMIPPITQGSRQGGAQKQVSSGTQGSERNLIWHEESQQWIQSSYFDEQSGQWFVFDEESGGYVPHIAEEAAIGESAGDAGGKNDGEVKGGSGEKKEQVGR
jgi:hypothetical protein